MDTKIILSLLGNVLTAFTAIFFLPIFYSAFVMQSWRVAIFFVILGILTAILGINFVRFGKNHSRKLRAVESAWTMLLIYPLIAIIGAIPFLWTGWLMPLDSALETISDLTGAGISLLPQAAPYILKIWQSSLMWFGSLIFLVLLVTLMPEVSGCFGMSLSLSDGQIFSPIFGQMNDIAKRVIKVYSTLTLLSCVLFSLAGLNFWDALLMSMRCISTGGGNFFPAQKNIYVEYAAIFTMLTACGNFLFYYRLIYTLPPPISNPEKNFFRRAISYVRRLKKNFFDNIKNFFTNSEVKTATVIIFFCVGIIFFSMFIGGQISDGNAAFRYTIFHVVSFMSTTGITLEMPEQVHDFDRFLIFLMAIFGGCMGSVTGGLKIMRVLVLAKVAAAEVKKTMHPHMLTTIRVNKIAVPAKIIGRILSFFFLAAFSLFICSAVLSFTGPSFSESVAISAACLTNVGIFPGICEPSTFLELSWAGKFFCAIILIVGRLEIFVLLIALSGLNFQRKSTRRWLDG